VVALANVLSHKMRTENIVTVQNDRIGGTRQVETPTQVVGEVTFLDYRGTPHTLTFHPLGTHVEGEAEATARVVGEDVPHYVYTDPAQAAQDWLDGKVK
jgi:hypothetical protein